MEKKPIVSGTGVYTPTVLSPPPPPTKDGCLVRSVFRIPRDQRQLLENGAVWVDSIQQGVDGTKLIPQSVLGKLLDGARKASSSVAPVRDTEATVEAAEASRLRKERNKANGTSANAAAATPVKMPTRKPAETTTMSSAGSLARTHAKSSPNVPKTPHPKEQRASAPSAAPTPPAPAPASVPAPAPEKAVFIPRTDTTAVDGRLQLAPPEDSIPSVEGPERGHPGKRIPSASLAEHQQALDSDSDSDESIQSQASMGPVLNEWMSQKDSPYEKAAQDTETMRPAEVIRLSTYNLPRESSPVTDLEVEIPTAYVEEYMPGTFHGSQQSQHSLAGRQTTEASAPPALTHPSPDRQHNGQLGSPLHEVALEMQSEDGRQGGGGNRRRRLMKRVVFPIPRQAQTEVPTDAEEAVHQSPNVDKQHVPETLETGHSQQVILETRSAELAEQHLAPVVLAHRPTTSGALSTVEPKTAQSRLGPPPILTWKLPFDAFMSAYADFKGDKTDFIRACYYLETLVKKDLLASFLFDDVIRAYVDFADHIQKSTSGKPISLLKWYNHNVNDPRYLKRVVTSANVATILEAYPEEVRAIRQQITGDMDSDLTESGAALVLGDHSAAPPHAAGPAAASQDTSAHYSTDGHSVWQHGQLVSVPAPNTLYGHSYDGSQSQPNSHPSQMSTVSRVSRIEAVSSPIASAALPPGVDKIAYMLNLGADVSQPWHVVGQAPEPALELTPDPAPAAAPAPQSVAAGQKRKRQDAEPAADARTTKRKAPRGTRTALSQNGPAVDTADVVYIDSDGDSNRHDADAVQEAARPVCTPVQARKPVQPAKQVPRAPAETPAERLRAPERPLPDAFVRPIERPPVRVRKSMADERRQTTGGASESRAPENRAPMAAPSTARRRQTLQELPGAPDNVAHRVAAFLREKKQKEKATQSAARRASSRV